MAKIRKQPKRESKKLRIKSLRNPFQDQILMCLPPSITERIKDLDHIILRHIDQLVCQPEQTPSINIEYMKEALYQQELKISGLKISAVPECSKRCSTQVEIDIDITIQQKSSNKQLQAPLQMDNLDWVLCQNQSQYFF